MQRLLTFNVGDITVTRIPEQPMEVADVATMFPYDDVAALASDANRWGEMSFDIPHQRLKQSIHSWLVRTPTQTVLIDTGSGNDKDRPSAPLFDHLQTPYLAYLHEAGVEPEDVDLVLATHLHADHVGWNTRWQEGHWQPTFPNARYVFSRREFEYNHALSEENTERVQQIIAESGMASPHHFPLGGVFNDSVLPIADAGLVDFVAMGDSVEGFTFNASPGHSINHASISVTSQGETALFWGDVMHHPLQVFHPEANSRYCEFLPEAVQSRQKMMVFALEHNALVFTTHFSGSGAGRLRHDGQRVEWGFEAGQPLA